MILTNRNFALTLVAMFLSLAVVGCAFEPPQTANEGAAYTGATVQSVQQTAIAQYPYMTKDQATEVHEAIGDAVELRTQVVTLLLSGEQAEAQTKLAKLQNALTLAQKLLNQYGADHE